MASGIKSPEEVTASGLEIVVCVRRYQRPTQENPLGVYYPVTAYPEDVEEARQEALVAIDGLHDYLLGLLGFVNKLVQGVRPSMENENEQLLTLWTAWKLGQHSSYGRVQYGHESTPW